MDLTMRKASPYVLIFEEPAPRGVELTVQDDGEVSGKIIGINSTADHVTYPKICIVSLTSVAYVQVSCITSDEPYRPHPHKLFQNWENGNPEDFSRGVVNAQVRAHYPVAELKDIKLQYISREDVKKALGDRKSVPVNPFGNPEWSDAEINGIDLNSVRLCFQVFIKNPNSGKLQAIVPVVSAPIYLKPPTPNVITPQDEILDNGS
ncbi:embryonic polarity protein dorsal [Fopius arisanus]|uniref:Dl_1 protein n=1 Tax=Fopius arisanus TaxID=64838 RepID=A0A0C9RBE3_9HYME|nr:PREDICTED: embryonic polarity protein dorsal-like [Fopius arisanus]